MAIPTISVTGTAQNTTPLSVVSSPSPSSTTSGILQPAGGSGGAVPGMTPAGTGSLIQNGGAALPGQSIATPTVPFTVGKKTAQGAALPPKPTDTQLNSTQTANFGAVTSLNNPTTRDGSTPPAATPDATSLGGLNDALLTSLQAQVAAGTASQQQAAALLPSVLQNSNSVQTYTNLRSSLGLDDLDAQYLTINSQVRANQTAQQQTIQDVRAEAAAAGGSVTESEIQSMAAARNQPLIEQGQLLQEESGNITDNLNLKNSTLNTLVQLTGQDRSYIQGIYSSLVNSANTSESNVLSILGNLVGIAKENATLGISEQRLGIEQQNADTSTARLGVTEQRAGSEASTASSTQTPKDLEIFKAQAAANQTLAQSIAGSNLKAAAGVDGKVSPQDFQTQLNAWVSDGYKATDFYTQFENFVNPAYAASYGEYYQTKTSANQ